MSKTRILCALNAKMILVGVDMLNDDNGSESEFSQELSTDTTDDHLPADGTFTINRSNYLQDLTLDGFPCDGLLIE